MANEKTKERIAQVLRYVADNVDNYIPAEWLLEGSTFAVRIAGNDHIPTVELSGIMPSEPSQGA